MAAKKKKSPAKKHKTSTKRPATKARRAVAKPKARAKTKKLAAKPRAKAKPAKKPAVAMKKKPASLAAKPKAFATKDAAKAAVRRRDGTGHLEASYAADLRTRSRDAHTHDGESNAFLRGPRTEDDLADQLGEEAVETMTSGENQGEDVLDQVVPEESGGPFVVTNAGEEFAEGTDASNPRRAKREPFPTT